MLSKYYKTLVLATAGFVVCETACADKTKLFEEPRTQQIEKSQEVQPALSQSQENRNLELLRQDSSQDVTFDGSATTDLRRHTTPSEGADFDPDIDPSGKRLIFASTRHSPNSHLYIKSITGATITQITDGPVNDAQPQFDSTGKRIAFASDRSGNWDIWTVDADGRNPTQITNSPMPELHPSWSPDGKRLVYSRINTSVNRGELWIAELDTPGVKRLIGEGLFPTWSPTGEKIAYQRARIRPSRWFSIWTLDIHNDEVLFPTEVASSAESALISPCWSQDGTRLAFSFVKSTKKNHDAVSTSDAAFITDPNDTAFADIGIVDVDGQDMRRLTSHLGEGYGPTWSSDGRVYFSLRTHDSETIWSVDSAQDVVEFKPPSATTTTVDHKAAGIIDMDIAE